MFSDQVIRRLFGSFTHIAPGLFTGKVTAFGKLGSAGAADAVIEFVIVEFEPVDDRLRKSRGSGVIHVRLVGGKDFLPLGVKFVGDVFKSSVADLFT